MMKMVTGKSKVTSGSKSNPKSSKRFGSKKKSESAANKKVIVKPKTAVKPKAAAQPRAAAKSKSTQLKTGVPGLDQILKGGINKNSTILVSGGPGTGKSIFAMQFLLEGAKNNELGLCILYDTDEDEYLNYAESLGIPLRKYVKEKKIFMVKQPIAVKKSPSLAAPLQLINSNKIKRVTLDSLTMFAYIHVSDDRDYRMEIVNFLERMKDVTLLATSEATGSNIDEVNFKAEDFLFDGVVFLTKVRQESSFERVLHVSKMRGQDHLIDVFPFFIGEGGITVYPDQIPFALVAKEEGERNNNKSNYKK